MSTPILHLGYVFIAGTEHPGLSEQSQLMAGVLSNCVFVSDKSDFCVINCMFSLV